MGAGLVELEEERLRGRVVGLGRCRGGEGLVEIMEEDSTEEGGGPEGREEEKVIGEVGGRVLET